MTERSERGGWAVTATFNLFNLKQQLEMQKGREYSWAEIARLAGLHRNTIDRIAANQTGRIDLSTITNLIGFFRSQGMPVTEEAQP
jgi:hypothetical protein